MVSSVLRSLGTAGSALVLLTGCTAEPDQADAEATNVAVENESDTATPRALSLADGTDVCFDAVEERLGSDVKIAELTTDISLGSEIEARDTEPAGTVTNCTVQYQDPSDPRKLLALSMAATPGQFGEPMPVEISVTGDAASFNLEDMLIPLGEVNASGLNQTLSSLEPKVAERFEPYGWEYIRFTAPDAFNDRHVFRVGVKGRLKTNDVQDDGQIVIAADGSTIIQDRLTS